MTRFPILLLSILLSLASLSLLDFERALVLRVEGMMALSPTTKSYTYLGDGWFEFTEEDGLTWQRNFGDTRTTGGLQPKKIISIDLRLVDTTGFESMFREIALVDIGFETKPPVGSFIGADSLGELTAQSYQGPAGYAGVRMYSMKKDRSFQLTHIFQKSFSVSGNADIDQNGLSEIVGDSLGCILTFEGSAPGSLDLKLKHFWYGATGSAQVPRIADLDRDGYPEVVISQFGDGFHGTRVVKYNSNSQKLERVFQIRYPNNPGHRGYYAVGDFDLDGKKEFANVNYAGHVFFVEHVSGDTSYAISFSDTTRYINAFFHTEGNDLDGDGRPECFIGSDNTGGLHNIAVYETTGDDQFEVSLWIEIYPLSSLIWQWIWAGDVTGDGKEELVLSSGNTIVILKAFGVDDYRVIWYKKYNSELCHRLFDVDRDGTMEILVSMRDGTNPDRFTRILKYDRLTGIVKNDQTAKDISVVVYPNPVSENATISIEASNSDMMELAVYSTMGETVWTKTHRGAPDQATTYSLFTSGLPNGIYLVRLKTGKTTTVRKFTVMR